MFPAKFSPVLFGFILTCLMTFLVAGISTFRAMGLVDGVFGIWMTNWLASWVVAFPVVLVIAPLTRKIVARLTS